MQNSERIKEALRMIDEENACDPNLEKAGDSREPRELLYAKRLSAWVDKLSPGASEELLIAARGQHIARWQIPRSRYPMDRKGYLRWREDLKKFHAEKVSGILSKTGFDPAFIDRVRSLILKKNLEQDPEVQVLEDALTLLFFEHQYSELARRTDHDKMIEILRKAWKKITPRAKEIVCKMKFGTNEQALLDEALAS